MKTHEGAVVNAHLNELAAIAEAIPLLKEEGGIVEVLRFLDYLACGKTARTRVAPRRKAKVAAIKAQRKAA